MHLSMYDVYTVLLMENIKGEQWLRKENQNYELLKKDMTIKKIIKKTANLCK